MGVLDWAPTPALNASADPAIRASDGASYKDIPAAIRGVMAATSALARDQGGALVSSGTGNVYVVTTNSGLAPAAGAALSFWADRDNTAEPTLNIDGFGPRPWRGADGLSQPAGAIQGGILYTVVWAGAEVGKAPGWYTAGAAGAAGSIAGVAFDFSGTLADRGQYDAQPKGKVFLAVADTPAGPSWTLYLKRSNGFGDWSSGLPIKASPAQSTADAQAAADLAALRAQAADAARAAAALQAGTSTTQASIAAAQAAAAALQASRAADSANEATQLAMLVGALSYDMGSLADAPDGSTNFDFGSL